MWYLRPTMTYAQQAWQPDTKKTHIDKVQVTQNSAHRIATGCVRNTRASHLHEETKILRLKYHMEMTGAHSFLAAIDQRHPLHYQHRYSLPLEHRSIRKPPATCFQEITHNIRAAP